MALALDDRGVVTRCGACGRGNRLGYASLAQRTRCGQCKRDLEPPAAPVEVRDTAAFEAAAAASPLPLVVDFWAPWCAPCRTVAPELERLAREHAGRWLVLKVNTDAQPELATRFRIQSIPTLAVVQHGREVARVAGARPAAEIARFVEQATAGHAAS